MGKLICTVELDKTTGVTVTVENKDDGITQTYHLDGTAITTTVKGNDATSTITQKQDSIAIVCNDFSVTAQTITCKSSKATLHHSDDTFDITSAKDLTEKSDAKVNIEATQDALLKGMNVTVQATTDCKLTGTNVKGEATAAAGLKGVNLSCEGSGQAEFKGGMTKLHGDAMNQIDGAIVKISGVMQIAGGGPPMMIG
jgi:hypothetical protein